MAHPSHLLLATLGSEAQVVTITLDLLREQGYPIGRLVILYTGGENSPTRESLPRLEQELRTYAGYRHLDYQKVCFADEQGLPLADILTPEQNRLIFRTTFETLKRVKQAGWTVHFSAAGGRKAMAAYALLSAQFLFDAEDRFWNLWSAQELLNSRRMHASRGEAELIRLPIPPWYIGLLKKERFIAELTPAEQRILKLMAQGHSDEEIAAERMTSLRTIGTQAETVRSKLRTAFGLTKRSVRYVLIREFGPYFDLMEALGYGDLPVPMETAERRAGR
jgi:CRISPR-associated Csx14 family protein